MIDSRDLRFSCTRCGKCCLEPGWVHFTPKEQKRAARCLGLSPARFRDEYGHEEDGTWIHVTKEEKCPFFEENGCAVYEARPEQCRTWPFWPENLQSKKAWNKVARFCPGAEPVD